MWPDSIAGQIEQGLIRDRTSIGLKACPSVVTYRFSAGAINDLGSFLGTYYADHEADLIVFLLDTGNLTKELATIRPHPEPMGKTPQDIAGDYPEIQARLKKIRDTMRSGGADFALAFIPDGRAISPLENPRRDQLPDSLQNFYSEIRPAYQTYPMALEYLHEVTETGIKTISVLDHLVDGSESLRRRSSRVWTSHRVCDHGVDRHLPRKELRHRIRETRR
jgi:hypothetical protein